MSLTTYTATSLIRHIHDLAAWPLPTGHYIRWGGRDVAPSWGSMVNESGGSFRVETSGPMTFSNITDNTDATADLYGTVSGSDRLLAAWSINGSFSMGDTVVFNAGAFLLRLYNPAALHTLTESMLNHIIGVSAADVPDAYDVALGYFFGADWSTGTFTELTKSGYSRQDSSGMWASGTRPPPINEHAYAQNTGGALTFGPAGTDWYSYETTAALVDSTGAAWWSLGSNASNVTTGSSFILDAESMAVQVEGS